MLHQSGKSFLVFSLDEAHTYKIDGEEWRLAYKSQHSATFSRVSDPGVKCTYGFADLQLFSSRGSIEVVPYGQWPADLRPAPVLDDQGVYLAALTPQRRATLEGRHAMVQGLFTVRELKSRQSADGEGSASAGFNLTDADIAFYMEDIRAAAEAYLMEELPDPEADLKTQAYLAGSGTKPRSKYTVKRPDAVSPRTLRKWVSAFKKGGKLALLGNQHLQGNRTRKFTGEELTLLAVTIKEEYLSVRRKTITAVVHDVKARFQKENITRKEENKPLLDCPGRDSVRRFIRGLNRFHVLVARYGQTEAMKRMRPVSRGIEVGRPLERVEIDEWKIDLLLLLRQSGLLHLFRAEDLTVLGLDGRTSRWWLVVAIDCRTRVILGMVLTPNPSASGAVKCLRMVVSDKGQFTDHIGALTPWWMYGTPEELVTDNGSAFKSAAFTNACIDLGITKIQTIAGGPGMRGTIESVFKTMSLNLLPRLEGRTFGDVVDRAGHPSEQRACLSVDDLCTILVRWVVDVYHNTPHEGLRGRSPMEQWEADLEGGNFPLKAAPTRQRKHMALGISHRRMLQKDGIRVLNVQYNNGDLAAKYLKDGGGEIEVRWFDEDIGSIFVAFEDGWREVPSVSSMFNGVNASTWEAARRALRAKDPKRQEWEVSTVGLAIRAIEDMVAARKVSYGIVDHGWTESRLAAAEKDALLSFAVVPDLPKTADSPDGFGRSIVPVPPPRPEHVGTGSDVKPDVKPEQAGAAAVPPSKVIMKPRT